MDRGERGEYEYVVCFLGFLGFLGVEPDPSEENPADRYGKFLTLVPVNHLDLGR